MIPTPELEEEALLLLLRQHTDDKTSHSKRGSKAKKGTSLRLEGVGDSQQSSHQEENTSAAVPPPLGGVVEDCDLQETLDTWASSCFSTMKALKDMQRAQEGRSLGDDRSISLVLMRSAAFEGCTCARCRSFPNETDPPELIWVTWLNNSITHGLIGRQARQVILDKDHRVVYSTAGTTFMGYPELNCNNDHADVIAPYVGAAMKKIKRTSKDRDQVPHSFQVAHEFCDAMLGHLYGVWRDDDPEPCVVCRQSSGQISQCPMRRLHWHQTCSESFMRDYAADGSDALASILDDARECMQNFRSCAPRPRMGPSWLDALTGGAVQSASSSASLPAFFGFVCVPHRCTREAK